MPWQRHRYTVNRLLLVTRKTRASSMLLPQWGRRKSVEVLQQLSRTRIIVKEVYDWKVHTQAPHLRTSSRHEPILSWIVFQETHIGCGEQDAAVETQ